SSAVLAPPSAFTSRMATCAPWRPKSRAISLPIPDPPPVMIATRSCSLPPAMVRPCSDSIEAQRILTVKRRALPRRPFRGETAGELIPLQVAAHQRKNRPIAAIHHAVGPELLHHVVDVGQQLLFSPVDSRLGEQAGDLAADVRKRRQLANVGAPGVQTATRDVRLAAVIQNETRCGNPPGQL